MPKSVSDTTVAFYLQSDFEAGHIISKSLFPAISNLMDDSAKLWSLSELKTQPELLEENPSCSYSWIDGQFIFMGRLAGNAILVSLFDDCDHAFGYEPDLLFASAQSRDRVA